MLLLIRQILILFVPALILHLGWKYEGLFFLNFLALVPVLMLSSKKSSIFLGKAYLSFMVWIVIELYGLYNIGSPIKASLFFIIIPIYFAFPFWVFYQVRKKYSEITSLGVFVLVWMVIELWNSHSQMGFPLLSLGNQFSKVPFLIQWYEYTGVLGGTLWILLGNSLLYYMLQKKRSKYLWIYFTTILMFPVIISLIQFFYFEGNSKSTKLEVAVVHTNLKYTHKYSISRDSLTKIYTKELNAPQIHFADFVLMPETALPYIGWEHNIPKQKEFTELCRGVETKIITGIMSKELLARNTMYSSHSSFNSSMRRKYLGYNGAICFDCSTKEYALTYKNKLVPFDEFIPYPDFLRFLKKDEILGDFKFSPNENINTFSIKDDVRMGVSICYESLFGSYTSKIIAKNANALSVILNEGWYSNDNLAQRFFHISRIRAIEGRKQVIRSSNSGFSGLIDEKGKVEYITNVQGIHNLKMVPNNIVTFYIKYGDFLGFISLMALIIFLFYNIKN